MYLCIVCQISPVIIPGHILGDINMSKHNIIASNGIQLHFVAHTTAQAKILLRDRNVSVSSEHLVNQN